MLFVNDRHARTCPPAPAPRPVSALVRARLARDVAAEDLAYAMKLQAEGKSGEEPLRSVSNRLSELEALIAEAIEETRQ